MGKERQYIEDQAHTKQIGRGVVPSFRQTAAKTTFLIRGVRCGMSYVSACQAWPSAVLPRLGGFS